MASRAVLVVLLLCTSTWGLSEEDLHQEDKKPGSLYPKKYQPINLDKFRVTTEDSTTTEESTTPERLQSAEVKDEDMKSISEEFFQAMKQQRESSTSEEEGNSPLETTRDKKSATTTFCVEIRPSNPYQKPFQVCEPGQAQPIPYQTRPQRPNPVYPRPPPRQPTYHQPQYPQPQPQPQYPQPQPPQQPTYQQPPQQPQAPVMVLPHVPVAEPYHVPSHKPASPAVYRTSGDTWGSEWPASSGAEGGWNQEWNGMEGRSSYGGGYGYDDDKMSLYDFHKKKEIKYVPLITHSYSKTKPLKFLKVLKDLKKDKYGYEDDYYQPQRPSYQQENNYHQDNYHSDSHPSSHGLVITCQPSAVGYTGQQDQAALHKHMQLMQGLYAQTQKLYDQQQLTPAEGGSNTGNSGGYVAPSTYRDATGWKGADGKDEEMVKAPEGDWSNKAPLSSSSSSASPSASPDPTARSHYSTHSGSSHKGSHGKYGVEDSVRSSGYGGNSGHSSSGSSSGQYGVESARSSGYGGSSGGSSHSGGASGQYGVDQERSAYGHHHHSGSMANNLYGPAPSGYRPSPGQSYGPAPSQMNYGGSEPQRDYGSAPGGSSYGPAAPQVNYGGGEPQRGYGSAPAPSGYGNSAPAPAPGGSGGGYGSNSYRSSYGGSSGGHGSHGGSKGPYGVDQVGAAPTAITQAEAETANAFAQAQGLMAKSQE